MNSEYIDYPFTSNGVNFISRVYTHSHMAQTIANLPAGIFEKLNSDAVSELVGDPSLLTLAELQDELNRVNDGGSHAFILLVENA
jgi:hypothetical protein